MSECLSKVTSAAATRPYWLFAKFDFVSN
jgi:hypothetical protein